MRKRKEIQVVEIFLVMVEFLAKFVIDTKT